MSERKPQRCQGHRVEIARNATEAICGMTPERRAEMGLPEEGWEEQVCRDHGVDPKKVLE